MEAVIFDGKEYVKASVVAEKFPYTQDYLGQLCRAKKVDARLVGRAWYLNLDSLKEHRTGRYKAPVKSTEIPPKKAPSNYLSRIDVEPVLKNKTVKIFKEKNGVLTELPVRYEQDEYSLIPKINKSAVSTSIPILPAEAERLKIKKEAKKFNITDFKAEALPEVFLSGKLKVDGIPEAIEPASEEVTDVNVADIANEIKPELKNPVSPKRIISIRQPIKKLPRGTHVDMRPPSPLVEQATRIEPVPSQKVFVKVSKNRSLKKVPAGVSVEKAAQQPVQIDKIVQKKSETPSREIKFSPDVVLVSKSNIAQDVSKISDTALALVVFLLATLVSLIVLVTNREVLVEGGSYADNLIFDTSNLTTFLASFLR